MNFNNFTIKAQEAVQEAVNFVNQNGQQVIEPAHLMAGVLKVGENVTNFIFQKLGLNAQLMNNMVMSEAVSKPKVSGGEPYLSRETNEVLQKAVGLSKAMGDEYVSLEPIMLALLLVDSSVSKMMKEMGFTEDGLRKAIQELRNGEKVTSQSKRLKTLNEKSSVLSVISPKKKG